MSYATEAKLDTEFGAEEITLLADRDRDGTRDAGVIAAALAWADNLINSKLVSVVPLPLTAPYPPRLVDIAADLAYYRLHRIPTDEATKRHDDAVRQLDAVRDGKENLGLDGTGATAMQEGGSVEVEAPARLFDDATLSGY
jgi:phage gp36-like protein